MPIKIPFDTGWQFITFLLLFCYYLSSKIHSLFKLGDQFLTMGLHQTFDVLQSVSNIFGRSSPYSTFQPRVRPSKSSGGVGRH